MKTKVPTKFPLQKKLLLLLKSLIPLHSVYVINMDKCKNKQVTYLPPQSKQIHLEAIYTLLIVGNKTLHKNLDDFMEEVYNKMGQHCKVYIIYCSISNLMERIDIGDNFLTRTLKETPYLYKQDNALSRYSQYGLMYHVSIYKEIKTIWKHRMKRAKYLFSIIDVIHEEEEPLSKLAVLHNAMEQICLGLLYVFWEFKPHHYALSYLLHLCSILTSLPNNIFPQKTFGLQRQYYMLCNVSEIMRFKGTNGTNDFGLKNVDTVLKRCKQFLKEAHQIGETQLKHLKKVHCDTHATI
ncbi:hypothetical protein QLS71_003015 [Mariniflexile litorale]|uniref:Uncharacterized protein n=1 Tax=Mariniflexile litorale TaxID=3045158 RepID=A0AAU7EIM7_9FLAO|nr:hypothetical protein [Mariniflexile sp. KMM 9835]MDQ8209990.1 hypothetical protein [Mariniflexile sp. KMM 9835]